MSWEHKTAPEIIIGPDAEKLLPYQRRGFSAQLPMNSLNNPRMVASAANIDLSLQIREAQPAEDLAVEPVIQASARCHPDRQRVGTSGLCIECAVQWYKNRVTK